MSVRGFREIDGFHCFRVWGNHFNTLETKVLLKTEHAWKTDK